MCAQPSNRATLIEGTLRCLETLPPERITARAIADESGANLASIGYHFGSKDDLITEAVTEGLDRWLAEIARALSDLPDQAPADRVQQAAAVMASSRRRHQGLARNFIGALAKAPHNPRIAALLTTGFSRSRPRVAEVLGLGSDQAGDDAAGLVLAMFTGLLIQAMVDPALEIDGDRLDRALLRFAHSTLGKTDVEHPGAGPGQS